MLTASDIQSHLQRVADERGIRILLACETGSRAWGFPSPDSDYDVRLIYAHPRDWYLSLGERKDTLDLMLEDRELDLAGWDLRKSLRLLWKSNPALLERIQSPIVYQGDPAFMAEIQALVPQFYSRIAALFHYLSLAKKTHQALQSEASYKLKTFFYALRSATACRWIVEREEVPPIEFSRMRAGLDWPTHLQQRVDELIALKATVPESYRHQGEPALMAYLQGCIALGDEQGPSLPGAPRKMETLDAFFLKHLKP